MTSQEAADLLGLSLNTIHKYVAKGAIQSTKLPYGPRGTLEISRAAVEAYRRTRLGKLGRRRLNFS